MASLLTSGVTALVCGFVGSMLTTRYARWAGWEDRSRILHGWALGIVLYCFCRVLVFPHLPWWME